MTNLIDNISKGFFKRSYTESLKNKICVTCGEKIKGFKDEISRKEYLISGMCQKCQDKTFV